MRFRPAALAAALLLTAPALGPAPSASAVRGVNWAPPASATIHPGMPTTSGSAGCTTNFVFTDKAGAVYIGQAAHCTSPSADPLSGTGCESASSPLGTPVKLGNSNVTGTLAYSSWLAMQKAGETDDITCRSNDFALVRIPDVAVGQVNPSVPVFGGPVGLASGPLEAGEPVYGYGRSDLRGELATPQQGYSLRTEPPGWYHVVYVLPSGVPGDSGGGFMNGQGQAFGVLITLNTMPPGSNGAADLAHALAYAQKHSGIKGLKLVPGTEQFAA